MVVSYLSYSQERWPCSMDYRFSIAQSKSSPTRKVELRLVLWSEGFHSGEGETQLSFQKLTGNNGQEWIEQKCKTKSWNQLGGSRFNPVVVGPWMDLWDVQQHPQGRDNPHVHRYFATLEDGDEELVQSYRERNNW